MGLALLIKEEALGKECIVYSKNDIPHQHSEDSSIVSTTHWHRVESRDVSKPNDFTVQCDICPRACRLHEGQRGLCYVRARIDDAIVLTTYGRSSGFAIDPIEKKPLNHFYPGSSVLSFGTAGCNLACKFCQNWDISKSREMDTLMEFASPEKIAQMAKQSGCTSVAYTYNDPTIFHEYAIDTAKACRALGIYNVAVTAGYVCEKPRQEFFAVMDAVNVDLKAFTDEFYWKQTGAHLAPVLETLQYIKHQTNVWLEITTLLIPGLNDSDDELQAMSEWIAKELGPDVPLHFSAFHPDYKMLHIAKTPKETLTRARSIALGAGLRYVYTGNVHDAEGGSTYCSQCGEVLVGRDWYQLDKWTIDVDDNDVEANDAGHCAHCGAICPGHFTADFSQEFSAKGGSSVVKRVRIRPD